MSFAHAIVGKHLMPAWVRNGCILTEQFTMAEPLIPDEVARFVLDKIDSVAQLEALLLLRNNRETDWSVGALAARLYLRAARGDLRQAPRPINQFNSFQAEAENSRIRRCIPAEKGQIRWRQYFTASAPSRRFFVRFCC